MTEITRAPVAVPALRGKTVVFVSLLEPWSIARDIGAPSFYETLKGFGRSGARLHYVTSVKDGRSADAHAQQVHTDLPGLTIHRFGIPHVFGWSDRLQSKAARLMLFPVLAAGQLRRVLSESRADLVYAYESSGILAAEWLRRRGDLRVPVVARYQGTILGSRYADVWYAVRKLESLLSLRARAAAYVMTNDGTLGDRALRHWNSTVTRQNLLFIRNGIDLSIRDQKIERTQALASRGLDPSNTYLLTVCRLIGWKRVDRAIRIVAALKTRFPKLRLLICGDGPARPGLEQQARSAGVEGEVHFLGGQPRAEVSVLMQAADIFLSLYDVSNCGNPLFEALLARKPLVTLDNGATSSVIEDRGNGRLVDPREEDRLPQVVAELLESPALREQIASGAREWADRELYSWDERISREIAWLQGLIASLR